MKMKLKLVIDFAEHERMRSFLAQELQKAVASAVGREFLNMNMSVNCLKISVKHVDLPSPPAEELKI